jgi:glucose dehydrogenase
MQANKNGFFYVLDRVTGAFISAQPFAKVTWAKGIDQETGKPIINPEAHYDQNKETITISPGAGGGHNWSPMSFNPTTGLVYVPTSTSSNTTYAIDTDFKYAPGRSNTGRLRGATNGKEPPAVGPAPAEGQRGVLVAWDPVTQKERWRTTGGGNIGGGTVTTASNLVLQVINDGRLLAYSADKGEKLFEVQTGLRGGMGPPITFMLDGKQYVALMGGQGTVVGNNAGAGANPPAPDVAATTPPPATPAPTAKPKLLVFALDAKGTLPVGN